MGFGDTLSQFNWVDVLVITLLFRTAYIGGKQGFIIEFFKLSAIIAVSFFTLHYYAVLAEFLKSKTPIDSSVCYIFSYLAISFLVLFIFKFARHSFLRIVKVEAVDFLRLWGGILFGLIRGVFVSSLICLFFFSFNNDYFKGSVRQSYSGKKMLQVAPSTYKLLYYGLIKKFNPNSRLNTELFDNLEDR